MQLNQLADQLDTKTIHLIVIARALDPTGTPSPHGGTPLSPERSQQLTTIYRYMRQRQISDPACAIAQMNDQPAVPDEITICIPASLADELCRRYPTGSMSDRILRLLGALESFEHLHKPFYPQETVAALKQPTSH